MGHVARQRGMQGIVAGELSEVGEGGGGMSEWWPAPAKRCRKQKRHEGQRGK